MAKSDEKDIVQGHKNNKGIAGAWKRLSAIADILEKLGSYVLVAMVLLTSADIILRKYFNSPLPFTFEVTEYLLVVVAWCYIAFTTSKGRHVSVDTITSHFSPKVRKILVTIGDFITVTLFGLIAWQNVLQGINVLNNKSESAILHIPKYPFQFWVAFGAAMACLILLFKVLNELTGGTNK
jgi:TRAP-type C4-dicarboxylate transport system permease small subunit